MMQKDNFMIKILSEQDADLLRACAELCRDCIPDSWSYESFLSEVQRKNGCVIAGLHECGQVVGFLTASYVCDTADLTNIAVNPEFRQQGIAFLLLEFLLRKLEKLGVQTVFLEVRRSNQPAIRLYEKSGFVSVGIRKNFYQHPDEDAILMQYGESIC
ncbi:MAG: ribosomal protein S18-alanine N-acetyltransferase [Oscillospiraceae bacterium]|nr:ribosomal protein S18-alanine N-acetyltransferase [Oscillospiraceae bacterium]